MEVTLCLGILTCYIRLVFQTRMATVYLLMEERKKSNIAKINLIQEALLFCSIEINEIEENMCLCMGWGRLEERLRSISSEAIHHVLFLKQSVFHILEIARWLACEASES